MPRKPPSGACACGRPRRPKQRTCAACHREYMQRHRNTYAQLNPEQKKRSNARSYLNTYIRRGKVIPGPCAYCGTTERKVTGHHKDYDKPLEVVWLCNRCHRATHGHLR